MNRYSSSVRKADWECSSKSVRGSFFVNPLYIKNLTNLTNLTTLQTLQPYRFCAGCTGRAPHFCAGRTQVQIGKMEFFDSEIARPFHTVLRPLRPVRGDGMETV